MFAKLFSETFGIDLEIQTIQQTDVTGLRVKSTFTPETPVLVEPYQILTFVITFSR